MGHVKCNETHFNALRAAGAILLEWFGGRITQILSIWEAPAEYLLVTEAGGTATSINGGCFNFKVDSKDYRREFSMVNANKSLHAGFMSLIEVAFLPCVKSMDFK